MPNIKISAYWAWLYCGLMILYSYLEMTALQTATKASSLLAISKFTIILIAIYVVIIKSNFRFSTTLSNYWLLWMSWLFLEFTVFFNAGSGLGFLHCFFAPFCFFLVLYLCIINPENENKIVTGFVILYLLVGAYSVYLSFYIGDFYWITGKLVSNLVFWPLCAFVFVPIVRKQLLQYLLLVPMIIFALLLAKRSAMIIITLEILFFSYFLLTSKKREMKRKYVFLYLIVVAFAFVEISSRMSSFTDSTLSRFETIEEDQGSGRIGIYQSFLSQIQYFSLGDLLYGRGHGSIGEMGHSAVHNDALQLFIQYGLVGLLFYVALIIILLSRIGMVKRYAKDCLVGYLFCVITIIVMGLVSNLIPLNSYFAFPCSYLALTEARIYRTIQLNKISASLRNNVIPLK